MVQYKKYRVEEGIAAAVDCVHYKKLRTARKRSSCQLFVFKPKNRAPSVVKYKNYGVEEGIAAAVDCVHYKNSQKEILLPAVCIQA